MTQTPRFLLITDCDEVLLHMVKHFGTWVRETHDIDFTPDGADFANSMRRRSTGETPTQAEMWSMLGGFFPSEMHRQTLVPHAAEALARLSEVADIVVLTNLLDSCRTARIDQLAAFGIHHRVEPCAGRRPARQRRVGAGCRLRAPRTRPGFVRPRRGHLWRLGCKLDRLLPRKKGASGVHGDELRCYDVVIPSG